LFPFAEEDLLLKEKLAYEKMDQIIIDRVNDGFQKKSLDLRKESKLASALSKSLLCTDF